MIRRKKTLPAANRLGASSGSPELKVAKPRKPFTGNQPGRMTMLPADEAQELKSAASADTEKTTNDIRKRASKPISG